MTEYLYSPRDVSALLRNFPLVFQTLRNPDREGEIASAFSSARKSPRQIYRILGNQHYPHLQRLLASIEGCLTRGWKHPGLLRTRSLPEFDSALAVLGLAEHLFELGLEPENADAIKQVSSVPDIYVQTPRGSLSIEVYVPRDWQGLEYFREEARLGLLHVDCSCDYKARFSITSPVIERFNIRQFSELYENEPRRLAAVDRILKLVAQRLSAGPPDSFQVSVDEPDMSGVKFDINFESVQRARTDLPARSIVFDQPTLTGYAPEAMFLRLLEKRIVPKIRQNQSGGAGPNAKHCRILFVGTHMLVYQRQFEVPWYRREFGTAVQRILSGESQSIDAVAFGNPVPFSVAILACLNKNSEQVTDYLGASEQTTILRMGC